MGASKRKIDFGSFEVQGKGCGRYNNLHLSSLMNSCGGELEP